MHHCHKLVRLPRLLKESVPSVRANAAASLVVREFMHLLMVLVFRPAFMIDKVLPGTDEFER
jgi:hypothetical protein